MERQLNKRPHCNFISSLCCLATNVSVMAMLLRQQRYSYCTYCNGRKSLKTTEASQQFERSETHRQIKMAEKKSCGGDVLLASPGRFHCLRHSGDVASTTVFQLSQWSKILGRIENISATVGYPDLLMYRPNNWILRIVYIVVPLSRLYLHWNDMVYYRRSSIASILSKSNCNRCQKYQCCNIDKTTTLYLTTGQLRQDMYTNVVCLSTARQEYMYYSYSESLSCLADTVTIIARLFHVPWDCMFR